MFSPNSSWANAERTIVASVTVMAATNQASASLPVPLVRFVTVTVAVLEA